jgi:3-hydroxyacyl-[acyl-carrier-protein] dehydratase
MRWIWIDRILELKRGEKLVAVKNITAGEDVLHDHFTGDGETAARLVMPHTLIIEGMAQTAGILVGHAGDFKEKVILAKISLATFDLAAPPEPGYTLRHTERIDPATGEVLPLATINLMFSHIDQNRSGLQFPEHNFVFTSQFMALLRDVD